MFRHLAPAGTPIGPGLASRWAGGVLRGSRALDLFGAELRRRMGVAHCSFASSGRAALVIALRALRGLGDPDRDEVVLPSYTCFSVPAAAARAGMKIRLCDVDPTTLDYDGAALMRTDFSKVSCIVATSLYGIPNDLPALSRLAKEQGVFLVDDAAQALGSAIGGRQVGTLGDVGILSFDKGKNITSIEGGAVLCDDGAIAGALRRESTVLARPSTSARFVSAAKLMGYGVFLHPAVYGVPARWPGLNLGTTIYSTSFPLETYKPELGAMARLLLDRLDALNARRVATARQILQGVEGIDGLSGAALHPGAEPAFLRCPLLVGDAAARTGLADALRHAGLGASTSYPTALDAVPELGPLLVNGAQGFPGGALVARSIVTLPTHGYVRDRDVRRMLGIIRGRQTARGVGRKAS